MTATLIPQEQRAVRLDPDLQKALEGLLEPYGGEELERAQAAVVSVYRSSLQGTFRDLLWGYTSAILEAIDADLWAAIGAVLDEYEGEELELARAAVISLVGAELAAIEAAIEGAIPEAVDVG